MPGEFDNWWDYLNPFEYLGSAAGQVAADAWTAAMLGVWNAGLFVLRTVLLIIDSFMTPYLGEDGPAREVYQVTFGLALILTTALFTVQLGIAAFRRDGASLGRAVVGAAQFLGVWAGWLAFCSAVVLAAGGIARGLMQLLLSVDSWAAFEPFGALRTEDITDGTIATVLGILGFFVVTTAFAMAVVWLVRAAALLVLAATTPISAAGLTSEAGRAWFWKSLRWFLATAATPIVMLLVLGIGVKLTTGVVLESSQGIQADLGTAVVGTVLICMSTVAPLGLFRLLAFVDPGTPSGAAMRAGVSAQGGISGLVQNLTAGRHGGGGTSQAASTGDRLGRSGGEAAAESSQLSRMGGGGPASAGTGAAAGGSGTAGASAAKAPAAAGAAGGALSAVGTVAGAAAGAYLAGSAMVRKAGMTGTSVAGDVANQAGMGQQQYQPDFTGTSSGRPRQGGRRLGPGPVPVPVPERLSGGAGEGASAGPEEKVG